MITVLVRSADGTVLASAAHPEEVLLSVDRVYQPGDVILISGARNLRVQMDQSLPSGEVYLPEGTMTWVVPAGEHRLAYAPGLFDAPRHIISAKALSADDLARFRVLSCNPADLRGDTDFYPHCTANVETRNEACFCARNVIDGLRLNTFHGEWPFQSWGIGAREDAWCLLDLGRPVIAEKMALTLIWETGPSAGSVWNDWSKATILPPSPPCASGKSSAEICKRGFSPQAIAVQSHSGEKCLYSKSRMAAWSGSFR